MEIHGNPYIHIQKTLAFVDFSALLCFSASHVPKYKCWENICATAEIHVEPVSDFLVQSFSTRVWNFLEIYIQPGFGSSMIGFGPTLEQIRWISITLDPLWTDHGPRRHLRQRTRFATVSLWIRTSSKKKPCACTVIVGTFHTCYWPVGQFTIYGFFSPVNFHVGDFPTFEYTRVDPPYEPREWIQTRGSKGAFKDT